MTRLMSNPLIAINSWVKEVYYQYLFFNESNFPHFREALMDTFWWVFALEFEEEDKIENKN